MLTEKQLHQYQIGAEHIYLKPGPTPGGSGDLIQLALGWEYTHDEKYEVFEPDHPLHRLGAVLQNQYLYIIQPCEDGGAEVMRVRKPGFYFAHPLPIDYHWLKQHCTVEGAVVHVTRHKDGYIYELALPWSELAQVPHRIGQKLRMNVLVQNDRPATQLEWSAGRSRSTNSHIEMEPGWVSNWTNETWWGFVGADGRSPTPR
jgi:hypothetical protein